MGRMSASTRSRVVSMSQNGFKLCKIQEHLAKEGITVIPVFTTEATSHYGLGG